MTNELTICDASLEDAAAVAEIYTAYVVDSAASFETEPPSASVMAQRIAGVVAGGYPWLIVRDAGNRVLGFAYADRLGPYAGFAYSCQTFIFVRNDALGRGIGTMLINALLTECEKRGFRQAFAMIAGTEPASVVLHARAGYLPCGTLTGAGWKLGQWTDVFMMQRKLGPGNEALPEGHA